MNPPTPSDFSPTEAEAAQWVLRLDRGLTAAEQDDYSQWLAADPRRREALALQRWGWEELDRLAGLQISVNAMPDPDLLAPARETAAGKRLRLAPWLLGVAAAVGLGLFAWWPRVVPSPAATVNPAPSYALAAPIEQRILEDGSTVELNRGAVVETQFTAAERRVRLLRGEANFIVAKNPARPFIVSAGGVEARAVGTVFNVRLDRMAVEVLVSEGRVKVAGAGETDATAGLPLLEAGQRTVVSLAATAAAPEVVTLTAAELERKTAWQPRLLDFTAQPLADIVAEFNRRNPVQLVLADPALETVRLSATFRSDNVEGFVRLMESDFGMRAEWRGETEIVLRKTK